MARLRCRRRSREPQIASGSHEVGIPGNDNDLAIGNPFGRRQVHRVVAAESVRVESGQGEAEAVAEQGHVVAVGRRQVVTLVESELHFGRQARECS